MIAAAVIAYLWAAGAVMKWIELCPHCEQRDPALIALTLFWPVALPVALVLDWLDDTPDTEDDWG